MNKLVDEYNNTFYHSIDKKPIDADYSALPKETETNPKSPKLRTGDRVRMAKYQNIFSKGYTETWSKEICVIDAVMKTNSWTYRIMIQKKETTMKSFSGKELLLSKL